MPTPTAATAVDGSLTGDLSIRADFVPQSQPEYTGPPAQIIHIKHAHQPARYPTNPRAAAFTLLRFFVLLANTSYGCGGVVLNPNKKVIRSHLWGVAKCVI